MAFSSNNYRNSDDVFTPTTYCAYKFFNSTSNLDKTTVSFAYWNGLLKVSITPIIVKSDGSSSVDSSNHISIYLSPAKASLFLHYVKEYRKNPANYSNIGVNTNKGLILLGNGDRMFGNGIGTILIIYLIDQNGEKEAEALYEFNTNEVFGIANYTSGNDFDKLYDYANSFELDILEKILSEYSKATTSAIASTVIDANKFNSDREYKFIADVRKNLGINQDTHNNTRIISNTSTFYNKNGRNVPTVSDNSRSTNSIEYQELIDDMSANAIEDEGFV